MYPDTPSKPPHITTYTKIRIHPTLATQSYTRHNTIKEIQLTCNTPDFQIDQLHVPVKYSQLTTNYPQNQSNNNVQCLYNANIKCDDTCMSYLQTPIAQASQDPWGTHMVHISRITIFRQHNSFVVTISYWQNIQRNHFLLVY